MYHKFIHNDNGIDCYRCGTSVDFPWLPANSDSPVWNNPNLSAPGEAIGRSEQVLMEEEIRFFLPNCAGPSEGLGHHWYALGADKEDYDHLIGAIECRYCTTRIGFETDLAYVPRYCKGD